MPLCLITLPGQLLTIITQRSAVADQLCVSAQQDPADGAGICQTALGAIRDFVDAKTPLTRSKQFGCLLNFICIAHASPENEGTCNQLLGVSGTCALKTDIMKLC